MPIKILSEIGGYYVHAHHQAEGYTSGVSFSHPFRIIPAPRIAVHVGLARLYGTHREAGGATIGISQYTFLNARGREQTVSFGPDWAWETALYAERVTGFTISIFVIRASMKGWFYYQSLEWV
jgi:hypothetical protein